MSEQSVLGEKFINRRWDLHCQKAFLRFTKHNIYVRMNLFYRQDENLSGGRL